MKKIFLILIAAVLCLTVFAACSGGNSHTDIGQEAAQQKLEQFLQAKGFGDEEDFLAEPMEMEVEGETVYAFSWRVKDGEHADRLFGTYAVSADGERFYEYQAERDIWILNS